jgi:di/tricarboxylate transporter
VLPGARIAGRTATELRLRSRRGVNLLAVSREGAPPDHRLRNLRLRTGDLLLMQGRAEALAAFAEDAGCVPLGERELRLPDARAALTAAAIMVGSVALAATGLLPAAVAFALGLLAAMVLGAIPLREVYTAIDWPVIVLLGAMIPVGHALEMSGGAKLVAGLLLELGAWMPPLAAIALLMFVTMRLTDVINNAAAAVLMAPVALELAHGMELSVDPFLMTVAVGASGAFLTPIGHQSNLLVMGPGGYRFGDYWRLGLRVSVV